MLKTNTKKAAENIRQYIADNFHPEGYTETPPKTFHETANLIVECFRRQKYHSAEDVRYYHGREVSAFVDWCAGLPSILDTCYYYNRSAVDDLSKILDETDVEKAKFNEADAEKLLTKLIYRELTKETARNA